MFESLGIVSPPSQLDIGDTDKFMASDLFDHLFVVPWLFPDTCLVAFLYVGVQL